MSAQEGHQSDVAEPADGPAGNVGLTPDEAVPAAEIQRQFTRYLRDPDHAPLPQGADALRMRLYAEHYRARLFSGLQRRAHSFIRALGQDRVLDLLNDYVRLPRASRSGESSFESSFFHWLKEECTADDLPPWTTDVADYCLAAMLLESEPETSEQAAATEDDLLAGVPVFSELARLLRLEWPAHRIDKNFLPIAKPPGPVWLIVYRNQRGEDGYLELNGPAAEIAALVRDNTGGRTGAEILADMGARIPLTDPAAALRDGLAILDILRQRGIIFCVRATG